ncbi:MAG: prenyltransferase, partial [Methanobacteriota archaeon]
EGAALDAGWLAVALALAVLVQGWETHAINEIYDWRSGTDAHASPRALSGGSKVVRLGLLSERDLWVVFVVSSLGVAVLGAYVGMGRAWWLGAIVVAGYAIGLLYTLPPVATSYRPLAGEWLGGFPGVLLAGIGAYAIQSLRITPTAIAALAAHALVCTAMLTMHHYLDVAADRSAAPAKRTTVVALGSRGARAYATCLAAGGASIYGALAFVQPAFALGAAFSVAAAVFHALARVENLESVTRNELRIIQLGIAAGLSSAVALAPALWPLGPLAVAGYAAHLWAVAPPAALARAWRRAPAPSGDGPAS